MPPIAYNDTQVVDRPWNGSEEESKLQTPVRGNIGKAMYAWFDPAGNDPDRDGFPDAKADWKFPHHDVGDGGTPGAAVVSAVRAALSRVSDSATNIPEADKAGVRSHLQKHLDKFNASKKSGSETLERARSIEVEGRTWAIRPELLASLSGMAGHSVSEEFAAEAFAAATRSRMAVTQQPGSVAVVPLKGVLMPQVGLLAMLLGMGSGLDAFKADFRDALNDPEVSAIVMDVDSPGGMVDQIPELADEIRSARGQKPIVAVANTLAASAAYWLASQADEVVVSPSGELGSIGVYQIHKDMSRAMDAAGISPTIVSAGKYKVEGNPYEPLSEEAVQAAQQGVDDYYNMFVAAVAKGRGASVSDVRNGYGEGRTLTAKRAVDADLADRVGTLESAVSKAQSGGSRRGQGRRAEDGETVPEETVETERQHAYSAEDRGRLLDTVAGLDRK